jgi:hypothetical protein
MFGRLPSELLALTPEEMGVNIACLEAWDESNGETIKNNKATVQLIREV